MSKSSNLVLSTPMQLENDEQWRLKNPPVFSQRGLATPAKQTSLFSPYRSCTITECETISVIGCAKFNRTGNPEIKILLKGRP